MTTVDRISVAMPPDVGAAVRAAADRHNMSVSSWMTEAAADKLRNELLGAAIAAFEAEDGPFSDGELDNAARALGITRRSAAA